MITVSRSALPDGSMKAPKSGAGLRVVPLLPQLRRLLVAWRLKSPHTDREDLIICTAEGRPVPPKNLRRAMAEAKSNEAKQAKGNERAPIDVGDKRLSLHSLRHSFASMIVTDFGLAPTTAAQIIGHADASTTLALYAPDARDEAALVKDVLARAAGASIGT